MQFTGRLHGLAGMAALKEMHFEDNRFTAISHLPASVRVVDLDEVRFQDNSLDFSLIFRGFRAFWG